jgi:hypothetical protein
MRREETIEILNEREEKLLHNIPPIGRSNPNIPPTAEKAFSNV